jgi:hypothetical protein
MNKTSWCKLILHQLQSEFRHAYDETNHHGTISPLRIQSLENTPNKNTAEIGGAMYDCTLCK